MLLCVANSGREVQVLSLLALLVQKYKYGRSWRKSCSCVSRTLGGKCRYSVYLLYWYKSTNTDAAGAVYAYIEAEVMHLPVTNSGRGGGRKKKRVKRVKRVKKVKRVKREPHLVGDVIRAFDFTRESRESRE